MISEIVSIVLALSLTTSAYKPEQYSVPEPQIEAFSPQGLRLSIPDSPVIKSVNFYLSLTRPIVENDPGVIAKEVDDKQGGRWIYYNPSIVLHPHDMIHFKIIVKDERGLPWSRWGSYPIEKVVSLADNSIITADCDEDGQKVAVFPNLSQLDGTSVTGSQKSEVKSAYSSYKSIDTKPITRSTTTSTSGTFYVKPSGAVEAAGHKTSSSFDSTRRDGEQWQHSKSQLTASDIEELKTLHGQDFLTLPAFAHLSDGSTGGSVSSSSYHKSYSSSSTSSDSRPTYGGPSRYRQEQQIGQVSDTIPIGSPSSYSYSKYEKQQSSQAVPTLINPAISYSASDSSYNRGPITPSSTLVSHNQRVDQSTSYVPSPSFSSHDLQIEESQAHIPVHSPTYLSNTPGDTYARNPANVPSYSSIQTNHYKKETVQKTSSESAVPSPYSSPSLVSNSKTSDSYTYNTAPKSVTVQLPLGSQQYYNGEIFRYPVKPLSPESCAVSDSKKRPSQVDVIALERMVLENQCLSVLGENTWKAEVYALKEANTRLNTRLVELEEQFQRFRRSCDCGY